MDRQAYSRAPLVGLWFIENGFWLWLWLYDRAAFLDELKTT
jgi:hypothetical protein